jgi:hypothetical protein
MSALFILHPGIAGETCPWGGVSPQSAAGPLAVFLGTGSVAS